MPEERKDDLLPVDPKGEWVDAFAVSSRAEVVPSAQPNGCPSCGWAFLCPRMETPAGRSWAHLPCPLKIRSAALTPSDA